MGLHSNGHTARILLAQLSDCSAKGPTLAYAHARQLSTHPRHLGIQWIHGGLRSLRSGYTHLSGVGLAEPCGECEATDDNLKLCLINEVMLKNIF